ncbi:cAMP-regulated phosphoprotein 21 [Neolecta irregularis DAH-3]|uniref:cAMP-regulated phosphoprotein 21 n=1 Tax=Neolecta irregularis (strain DAH-3) TaxID=1198029 RepID=A0A1U7LIT4_NEOID|nr:cAMP-regulated phosphoprotein 21 [Neolecta irregularis DAH-3]|eukprot:OLL22570.1 cAMP-regulated phosphoprotein 21 [Neolecta irregularis DAH-3]
MSDSLSVDLSALSLDKEHIQRRSIHIKFLQRPSSPSNLDERISQNFLKRPESAGADTTNSDSTTATNTEKLDDSLIAALSNGKDRLFLLGLERSIEEFMKANTTDTLELGMMNSYQRLLAHRLGDYWRLTHVVDENGKSVIFFRSHWSKIPTVRLRDAVTEDPSVQTVAPKKMKIMRRDTATPSETYSSLLGSDDGSDVPKTKEQIRLAKEEAYKAARARIFKDFEESEVVEGSLSFSDSSINNLEPLPTTKPKYKLNNNPRQRDEDLLLRPVYNAPSQPTYFNQYPPPPLFPPGGLPYSPSPSEQYIYPSPHNHINPYAQEFIPSGPPVPYSAFQNTYLGPPPGPVNYIPKEETRIMFPGPAMPLPPPHQRGLAPPQKDVWGPPSTTGVFRPFSQCPSWNVPRREDGTSMSSSGRSASGISTNGRLSGG